MRGFSTFFQDKGTEAAGLARRHTREPMNGPAERNAAAESGAPAVSAFTAAGRVKIGFVGLSAGAGATTIAFAAAEYIAAALAKQKRERSVTLLELDLRADAPAGRPYDKAGIDRRFAGRSFASFYRLATEGKPLQGVRNLNGGINWALRIPGESGLALSPVCLHRLLHNVPGDIMLCDISAQGFPNSAGTSGREALRTLLADFNRIICILDPLPSRLLVSVPVMEVCRAAAADGIPVVYVINKLNPGVNLREVKRFTGVRDHIPFPAIPAETVYTAEYACRSLAPEPAIKTALQALFAW